MVLQFGRSESKKQGVQCKKSSAASRRSCATACSQKTIGVPIPLDAKTLDRGKVVTIRPTGGQQYRHDPARIWRKESSNYLCGNRDVSSYSSLALVHSRE